MISEERYICFLIRHNITQAQYLLLHLIYKKRVDLIIDYKKKFPSEDGTMIGEYYINDLIYKGFLKKDEKDNIEITNKFLNIFMDKHLVTEEIYKTYPTHFEKDGVQIPLSAMDRNVFANLYDIAIESLLEEHQEVIKDIEYGKSENLLNIGLDKFLKSKYWQVLRGKRLNNEFKIKTSTRLDNEF